MRVALSYLPRKYLLPALKMDIRCAGYIVRLDWADGSGLFLFPLFLLLGVKMPAHLLIENPLRILHF